MQPSSLREVLHRDNAFPHKYDNTTNTGFLLCKVANETFGGVVVKEEIEENVEIYESDPVKLFEIIKTEEVKTEVVPGGLEESTDFFGSNDEDAPFKYLLENDISLCNIVKEEPILSYSTSSDERISDIKNVGTENVVKELHHGVDSSGDTHNEHEISYELSKMEHKSDAVDDDEKNEGAKPDVNSFVCSVCDKHFKSAHGLNIHSKIHQKGSLECGVCKKKCRSGRGLKIHTKTFHSDFLHKCDLCEKTFSQKRLLRRHKVMHFDERPYKCDICSDSFAQSSALNMHKKIHFSARPYKCEICGDDFKRLQYLQAHARTHSNERPFLCDICGKGFKLLGNVKEHKMSHFDVRPHKCDICNKTFKRFSYLKTHKISHYHPDMTFATKS